MAAAPVEAEIIVEGDADRHTSTADLLRFTLPTLGIWLIGPILSLVDTAFVGAQVHLSPEPLCYAAQTLDTWAIGPILPVVDIAYFGAQLPFEPGKP